MDKYNTDMLWSSQYQKGREEKNINIMTSFWANQYLQIRLE